MIQLSIFVHLSQSSEDMVSSSNPNGHFSRVGTCSFTCQYVDSKSEMAAKKFETTRLDFVDNKKRAHLAGSLQL
jgi:hypothetical protein